jgi:hypothetical protein
MNDGRLKLIVYFIILLLAVFLVTKVLFKSGGFDWHRGAARSNGIRCERQLADVSW